MQRRMVVMALFFGVALIVEACTRRDIVSVDIGTVTAQPVMASLLDGQSLQFTATVTDAGGTLLPGASVSWASDEPDVVTIDQSGLLVALRAGTATVRASFRDAHGIASVTVYPSPGIVLSEDSLVLRAVLGAEPPPPAVIQVLNRGVGTVDSLEASVRFAHGQPAGWLTASLGADETPTSLTLTPGTSALPGGAYEAEVILASSDESGPHRIRVSLSVTRLTVTATRGSTGVSEAGETDTISVVLDAAPSTDVAVSIVSGDSTEAAATPRWLVFTPSTWDTPRSVVIAAPDDPDLDGDSQTPLTIAVVDSLSDPAYAHLPDQTVVVTTFDDDVAGFTIVESDGSTMVAAAGGADDFTVALDARPASDVVMDVRSDPRAVTVSRRTLIFTPTDWAMPQVVAVTGVDDGIDAGLVRPPRVTIVTVAVNDDLSDGAFDSVSDRSVRVVILYKSQLP